MLTGNKTVSGRVMIVDDTKFIRELFARYLQLDGHTITEAGSSIGLASKLREGAVEVLLLDINLPGPGLLDTLRAIRSEPELSSLAIILVSGLDDDDLLAEAFELGADDFLRKPPNFFLLRNRVRAYLSLARLRP